MLHNNMERDTHSLYAYMHMFSVLPALYEGGSCDMLLYIHVADGALPVCFVKGFEDTCLVNACRHTRFSCSVCLPVARAGMFARFS